MSRVIGADPQSSTSDRVLSLPSFQRKPPHLFGAKKRRLRRGRHDTRTTIFLVHPVFHLGQKYTKHYPFRSPPLNGQRLESLTPEKFSYGLRGIGEVSEGNAAQNLDGRLGAWLRG